jgi:hypothetical protein
MGRMGPGYWLNPTPRTCVRVATSHNEWLRDKNNVKSIGLLESVYDEIMEQPETAIDEIRMVGLRNGLVRMREHARYLSVQFMAEPHRVRTILRAVVATLTDLKVHSDTRLVIDNLSLNDSVSITLAGLQENLDQGWPGYRERQDGTGDVPMGHLSID